MSLPILMVHRADHYSTSYSKVAGAKVPSYPATPTTGDIPCNVQPDMSDVSDGGAPLLQRTENRTAKMYLIDGATFNVIKRKDRITTGGINYHVSGKQDLCGLARVYEIDLEQEQTNANNSGS